MSGYDDPPLSRPEAALLLAGELAVGVGGLLGVTADREHSTWPADLFFAIGIVGIGLLLLSALISWSVVRDHQDPGTRTMLAASLHAELRGPVRAFGFDAHVGAAQLLRIPPGVIATIATAAAVGAALVLTSAR